MAAFNYQPPAPYFLAHLTPDERRQLAASEGVAFTSRRGAAGGDAPALTVGTPGAIVPRSGPF